MANDKERISDKNILIGARKPHEVPPKSGLFHSVIQCGNIAGETGRIKFQKATNETVLSNNGAWIVLGTDRPNSIRSGYGASGGCKAASIDLVVGRLATARKGKGPPQSEGKNAFVNPDFSADAARIYISQMTDIDHNFGIAEGNAPQSKARSGIGVKADAVRIIGRESVRIVTGGMQDVKHQPGGEPTSLGRKIQQPAPTIEFIAGNKIEDKVVWGGLFNPRERIRGLQGIAMGGNTRDALGELCDNLEQVIGAVMALASIAEKMYLALGIKHPFALGGVAILSILRSMLQGKMSLYHVRAELTTWRLNYLTAGGYKAVWSRNVKTT
jgi:hypothetical protein